VQEAGSAGGVGQHGPQQGNVTNMLEQMAKDMFWLSSRAVM
jgi:hypothetical protein